MIKERLQKAQNAWNLGQKYFLNTKTDKKYRIQLFNACIKPILQYGMITQNITDVNIKKLQQKFSKMLRKIEEKEEWQKIDRTKNEEEKRIKQKKNSAIRKKWKIPTIRSTLKKDKLNYNIRSKKTSSITYHTMKEKIDQEILSIREELNTLKEKTKHYEGKHAKQSLTRPSEKIIEEIKKEEKEKEEREKEKEEKEKEEEEKKEEESEDIFEQEIKNHNYEHPIHEIIEQDIEEPHKIRETIMPEKYIKKRQRKDKKRLKGDKIRMTKTDEELKELIDKKKWAQYRQVQKKRKERWERKNIQKNELKNNEAIKIIEDIPLETIKKEQLIEQLQRTNLQHCDDDRITKLSPLLYTTKEKWEEEMGEETGKVETCLCCGSQHKTKSTLGLHINKNEECAIYYAEYNERPKPCGQGNCNFAHKNKKILKRHQREACSGEQKLWDPNKRVKVDKIQAVADKINKHTKEIANGQIRQINEDTWECVTCGKIESTQHLKSLMGHLGKHNRKTKVGKKTRKNR
jgi:hypothetical protein